MFLGGVASPVRPPPATGLKADKEGGTSCPKEPEVDPSARDALSRPNPILLGKRSLNLRMDLLPMSLSLQTQCEPCPRDFTFRLSEEMNAPKQANESGVEEFALPETLTKTRGETPVLRLPSLSQETRHVRYRTVNKVQNQKEPPQLSCGPATEETSCA